LHSGSPAFQAKYTRLLRLIQFLWGAAGYKWALKKVKWSFAGVPAGGFRQFDMDEIRRRYGSQRVVTRSTYPMEEADG